MSLSWRARIAGSSQLYQYHDIASLTPTPAHTFALQISHLQQQLSHLEFELEGERASSSHLQSQLSSALSRSSDREEEAQGVVRRWEEERGALQGQLRELQRQLAAAREEAAKQVRVCRGGRDKQIKWHLPVVDHAVGVHQPHLSCAACSQRNLGPSVNPAPLIMPCGMHVVFDPIAGAGY